MSAGPTPPAEALIALANTRFPNLSQAEERLLRAAPNGGPAMCGPNLNDEDPANDPSKADNKPEAGGWGRDREIRADLLRWLCTDPEAMKKVDPRGVWAYGAKITGELDLSYATVPFPLLLYHCRFDTDNDLSYVKLPTLDLKGTFTKSINLERADVRSDIFLRYGFSAEGEVRLLGAQIGGDLDCDDGTFRNAAATDPDRKALFADGADVRGYIFLRGARTEGEVNLLGAHIGRNLECDGGTFKNPRGTALSASTAQVKGNVYLRYSEKGKQAFSAEGEVRLLGAQISGDLDCDGGTFKNPRGTALYADGAGIKGGMFLCYSEKGKQPFSAEGEVRLLGAQISGDLDCDGGTFKNPSGTALSADTVEVRENVFLRCSEEGEQRFSATGDVFLMNAHIGGDLDCSGGSFENSDPDGYAMAADGAEIKGGCTSATQRRASNPSPWRARCAC